MAEMVPVEFWNWAIPQVKKAKPEIIFIAEIYNPDQYRNYIQTGRFDFLYDKVQLYDTLRDLTAGRKSTLDIQSIQENLSGINSQMLHFLENHDEQRIASPGFAGNPWKAVPAMVISALIDQGPVMIYFGQEVGEPGAGKEGFGGEDGRTTIFDYWGVPEHQKWVNGGKFDGGLLSDDQKNLRKFYSTLLTIAKSNKAITQGQYVDVTAYNVAADNFNDRVHAFLRIYEDETLLVVTNFSSEKQTIRVSLEQNDRVKLDPTKTYVAEDILWGTYQISIDKLNTTIELPECGAFIFKIE
jgi:glycosidase